MKPTCYLNVTGIESSEKLNRTENTFFGMLVACDLYN